MKSLAFSIGTVLCILALSVATPAQTGTPAPGSIEAALAIEDPAERIAALRKFLRTNIIPEQTQTAREAIVASWAQIADSHLNTNEIDKAMDAFRESIGSLPGKITDTFFNDTVIRIPLAVSVRGYRTQAVLLARELEARFPGEGRRLAAIGEFYMTIEAPGDAIRALEKAAAAGEDTALLHRALGAAYRIGLRLDDAITQYQQAIRLDPMDKRAYYELGNLYRAFGAYEDALGLYRKQLEIEPRHTSSWKGIALAHLAMGDEEKATAALNRARDIRGATEELTQDLYLQTQLAFLYLQKNNLPQARKAAEAALLIEPRYAWARIAAAEVDLVEGKYFDAERNLLAARQYAGFPSLSFAFGKLYLAVEDFDGAIEQFASAFEYSPAKGFTARLGGSLDVQAGRLADLLAGEHRAAIYLADAPAKPEVFRLAESLVRFDVRLRMLRDQIYSAQRPATRKQLEELDREAMDFIEVENLRKSFRSLYIAQRLAQAGVSTGTAAELADIALGLANIAVGPEGSLRDYPNFDFQGRLSVFKGRALDARGWALFKSGKIEEAAEVLSRAVAYYDSIAEGKKALRRLATVKESLGGGAEALDLYIAAYEPPADKSSSDIDRTVIEVLYRKINGSLDGLDRQLERRQEISDRIIADLTRKYPKPVIRSNYSATGGVLPTDPMFARRDALRPEPAEPEPLKPVAAVSLPSRTPVRLPEFDSRLAASVTLPAAFDRLVPPPYIEEFATSKLPVPDPPQPARTPLHTRKRRVTVPDDPPNNF